MGDPKLTRKKFVNPPHPWQKSRIEEERALIREYGLKNKQEVWKMRTISKSFADQAKRITAQDTEQSKKEEGNLLSRLSRMGILPQGSVVDDILSITARDVLDRRLQTIVFKKGLAKSIGQARQFVTHRHIAVGNKVITAPSYLVTAAEEPKVSFVGKSPFIDEEHPERAVEKPKPQPKKPEAKEGKSSEKDAKKSENKKEDKEEKKEQIKPAEEKKSETSEQKKEDKEKSESKKETKEELEQEKKEKPSEKEESKKKEDSEKDTKKVEEKKE